MKKIITALAATAALTAPALAAEPPEVPYEFAFAVQPEENEAEAEARLREEALDYCRTATRAAGVADQARDCAAQLVAHVDRSMDARTQVAYAGE